MIKTSGKLSREENSLTNIFLYCQTNTFENNILRNLPDNPYFYAHFYMGFQQIVFWFLSSALLWYLPHVAACAMASELTPRFNHQESFLPKSEESPLFAAIGDSAFRIPHNQRESCQECVCCFILTSFIFHYESTTSMTSCRTSTYFHWWKHRWKSIVIASSRLQQILKVLPHLHFISIFVSFFSLCIHLWLPYRWNGERTTAKNQQNILGYLSSFFQGG